MLYRKIKKRIEEYLSSDSDRMLLIDGARQIGKSYIIRHVGKKMFPNYIEINMEEDKLGDRVFADAKTTKDFYMTYLSGVHHQSTAFYQNLKRDIPQSVF